MIYSLNSIFDCHYFLITNGETEKYEDNSTKATLNP